MFLDHLEKLRRIQKLIEELINKRRPSLKKHGHLGKKRSEATIKMLQ